MNTAPQLIALDHDDYYARHVGRTKDGLQFFLTNPFCSAQGDEPGCEYIALYLFNADGSLRSAQIDSLGPRASFDRDAARARYDQRLNDLGEVTFERIEVAPFTVEREGTVFGFELREPEAPDDDWAVDVVPGHYMAFFAPWDSGYYDT